MATQKDITNTIAPCEINCATCYLALRDKKPCVGCNVDGEKPGHCLNCNIKNCLKIKHPDAQFCFECDEFPCARIKRINKQYPTKYQFSSINNLLSLKKVGLKALLKLEQQKWRCHHCGNTLCVHYNYCLSCKQPRPI